MARPGCVNSVTSNQELGQKVCVKVVYSCGQDIIIHSSELWLGHCKQEVGDVVYSVNFTHCILCPN